MRRYITIAAIAASIILPFFIFFGGNNEIIRANPGEQLSYTFPDQSTLQLNSGSTIEYNHKQWEKKREVILKGEAFFDVEKGSRFDVVTNNGTVTVLGTSFNVFSRSRAFKVECKTGKVEVKTQNKSFILNPGDGISIDEMTQQIEQITFNPLQPINWLKGEYHFENTRLSNVFEEISRQFNLEIKAKREVQNLRFTGSFKTSNLDSALYQVCWPMNLESNKEGSNIVIKRRSLE